MALIKCPECGGMVSDEAKKCPHCGTPINNQSSVTNNPKVAQTKNVKSKESVSNEDKGSAKKVFERKKIIIILCIILILIGIIGFFAIRSYKTDKGSDVDTVATDTVDTVAVDIDDTVAVDTVASADYEDNLPTFSELKDFVWSEDNDRMNSMDNLGLSLLYKYEEPNDGESAVLENDVFFGKDAKVSRNKNGEYNITPTSDHAIVIAIYKCDETIPFIYFSKKDDYDEFKKQCNESGFDMSMIQYFGSENSEFYRLPESISNKWYKVQFLQ